MSRPVKNLFLIIGLFTLYACNKRVDNFELEYSGDQLVLFGNISNQQGVTVYLTHTLPPTGEYYFDEIEIEVSGAIIVLFENDIAVDTLIELTPGNYFVSYLPTPEYKYAITCSAIGYETIYSGIVSFPEPIVLEGVNFISGFENINGDPACSVLPVFIDDINTDNYYTFGFSFLLDENVNYGNVYETPDASPLGCESGVFIFESSYYKIFSDNCFAGASFPFSFISSTVYHEDTILPFSQFNFSVGTVSSELPQFITNQSETSGIILLFSDPKINYSNITNGFGMFWAQNDTTFEYHF